MNNQLPSTQEASLVLGLPRNQEINTSKHFNRIFIKVQMNSAILMQARSYNLQWWKNNMKKQSTHQTRTPGSQKKKDCVCVCDSKGSPGFGPQLIQKDKEIMSKPTWLLQAEETRLPGWWGKQWRCGPLENLRIWRRPPGGGYFPAPAPVSHPWPHRRWRTNSIYSSSHKIRFLSVCPEQATIVPYLLHLIVFN